MAAIRMQVGAALDANPAALFKPFADAAVKASKVMGDAARKSDKEWAAVEKKAKEIEKEFARAAKEEERTQTAAARAAAREQGAAAKKAEKEWKAVEREAAKIEKEFSKAAKQQERDQAQAAKSAERSWKAFASNAASNFRGIMSGAARIGGGLLRGAGVNFDLSSNVQGSLESHDLASKLSRKGFQEGADGAAGVKQSPADLLKEAGSAADATAKSTNEMLKAMTHFVENSGDLEGARKMITDIGKVSNATGADLETLAGVAGKLDLKLQDSMKDAGQRQSVIGATLRVFAAQGKTGAIDIEQLAPQISRLSAQAGKLGMDPTKAFQTVGIAAQIAAGSGGKGTPAMAAGAVTSLIDAMSKSKDGNLGPAKGRGGNNIPVFSNAGHTSLRNPLEVAAEVVATTKGDLAKMSALIPNVRANAVGMGLQSIYSKAGGGSKGEQAMRDAITRYTKAVMSQEEVERENADRLKETTAKAQVFQNQLERVAGSLAERVLPQMEKFGPAMLGATQMVMDFVGFMSEHPGLAIATALAASIAKAGIGEVLSGAIKSSIGGATSASGAVGGGLLAGGLVIAMATIAITTATILAEEAKGSASEKESLADMDKFIARVAAKANKGEALTPEEAGNAGAFLNDQKKRMGGDARGDGVIQGMKDFFAITFGSKTSAQVGEEKVDAARSAELAANVKALQGIMQGIKDGVLKVQVTNPQNGAPGGTSGPTPPGGT